MRFPPRQSQRSRRLAHRPDQLAQAGLHLAQRGQQLACLVAAAVRDAARQVALGHVARAARRGGQRARDAAGHRQRQHQAEHDAEADGGADDDARARSSALCGLHQRVDVAVVELEQRVQALVHGVEELAVVALHRLDAEVARQREHLVVALQVAVPLVREGVEGGALVAGRRRGAELVARGRERARELGDVGLELLLVVLGIRDHVGVLRRAHFEHGGAQRAQHAHARQRVSGDHPHLAADMVELEHREPADHRRERQHCREDHQHLRADPQIVEPLPHELLPVRWRTRADRRTGIAP